MASGALFVYKAEGRRLYKEGRGVKREEKDVTNGYDFRIPCNIVIFSYISSQCQVVLSCSHLIYKCVVFIQGFVCLYQSFVA